MKEVIVSTDDSGVRLDRLLRRKLPRSSLGEIHRLIRTGGARVNGRRAKAGQRLVGGDRLSMRVGPADVDDGSLPDGKRLRALARTSLFRRRFRIVFEDEVLLACDKPPHLVVHSGTGHTNDDSFIDLARAHTLGKTSMGVRAEAALVHRLDRDTSGLLLLAKNRRALRVLHQAIRQQEFVKRYCLVCHGHLQRPTGIVEVDLVKTFDRNDGTKVKVGRRGVPSRSSYRVVRRGHDMSLVEAFLHTGRTHQIRVHMSHLGCPIVGDTRYGDRVRDGQILGRPGTERRLYLHAQELTFRHPVTGEEITLEAQTPPEFGRLMQSA